jgi:hypothetical protein
MKRELEEKRLKMDDLLSTTGSEKDDDKAADLASKSFPSPPPSV